MITADFYTAFYVGVMVVVAVINGIQFGGSKGFTFRRIANFFQLLVFMAVPIAFVVGGQTSGFYFWTIIAFFVCAVIDVVELTLISCGKVKVNTRETKKPEQLSQKGERRGALQSIREKGESFVEENPRASQGLSIVFSLLLTFGVFFVSVLLVTGYFFQ